MSIAEIKSRLDQYEDVQVLRACNQTKDLHKIREIFRVISICYFNKEPVWMRKLLGTSLASPFYHKIYRSVDVTTTIMRLDSKMSYEQQRFKIGCNYVSAAVKWLKEKGYITTRKEGRKKLLIPTRDYELLAFLMSLDDKFIINVLKSDLSDLFTRGLNVGRFLVGILGLENKTYRKRFFTIVSDYPEVKEELLKNMGEKAEVYELGAKKTRGMMEELEKTGEGPPYSVTV